MKVIVFKVRDLYSYFKLDNFKGIGIYNNKKNYNNAICICFFKNGRFHRYNGPAKMIFDAKDDLKMNHFAFYYNSKFYGNHDDFTNKYWKKYMRAKEREERLKVFI